MTCKNYFSSKLLLGLVFLNFWLIVQCKKEKEPAKPPATTTSRIYFNSFETAADTAGWKGYGMFQFQSEAPANGGKQSLYVSGGCAAPHAWTEFKNDSITSYVHLYCFARVLQVDGHITLTNKNNPIKSLNISFKDSVWTSYHSKDSLFCRPFDTLRVELLSGGINAAAMLVDLIEVVRVK
jgi:hypothetical protein